jgi:hypothetical protein
MPQNLTEHLSQGAQGQDMNPDYHIHETRMLTHWIAMFGICPPSDAIYKPLVTY